MYSMKIIKRNTATYIPLKTIATIVKVLSLSFLVILRIDIIREATAQAKAKIPNNFVTMLPKIPLISPANSVIITKKPINTKVNEELNIFNFLYMLLLFPDSELFTANIPLIFKFNLIVSFIFLQNNTNI